MKKYGILNRDINCILGQLGHTDQITIADCGLPIPDGVKVIDLSLKLGVPSFKDVLDVIIENMQIEKIYLANEIIDMNKDLHKSLENTFKDTETEYISHEQLKKDSAYSKVIIRTGEATPYANIILQSGVIF